MSWYFPVITFLVIFTSFDLPCCVSFGRFSASSVYHFLVYFTAFCCLSLCAFVFVTFKPVGLFNRTQACYCFSGFLHSTIEYVASLLSPVAIGFNQFHQFCISLFVARPVFSFALTLLFPHSISSNLPHSMSFISLFILDFIFSIWLWYTHYHFFLISIFHFSLSFLYPLRFSFMDIVSTTPILIYAHICILPRFI